MFILFENSNLSKFMDRCLAFNNETKQWGFLSHGAVGRTISSSIYGWTKIFTPIYWDRKRGDVIPTGSYTSVMIREDQPTLVGTFFGEPTRTL